VTSKSAITPFFKGCVATMFAGVRPIMLLAADPTAKTFSVFWSMATTEGSERTIPHPLTNTSVFPVPRSIATSGVNSPPEIPMVPPRTSPKPSHEGFTNSCRTASKRCVSRLDMAIYTIGNGEDVDLQANPASLYC